MHDGAVSGVNETNSVDTRSVGVCRGSRVMHQSIPAAPIPPRATAGHLHTLSVPGVGH